VDWSCLGLVVFAGLFGRIELLLSLGTGLRVEGLDVSLRWGLLGGRRAERRGRQAGSQRLAPVKRGEESKEAEILKWKLDFL